MQTLLYTLLNDITCCSFSPYRSQLANRAQAMLRAHTSSTVSRPQQCRNLTVVPRIPTRSQHVRRAALHSVDAEPTVQHAQAVEARIDELIPDIQGLVHSTESVSNTRACCMLETGGSSRLWRVLSMSQFLLALYQPIHTGRPVIDHVLCFLHFD